MTNCEAVATINDFYLKAPRFIDHHLTENRSADEIKQAKCIIKKIISYCIIKDNGKKIVVDLEDTEHIEKSFIRILAGFAQDDPNLIMYHPTQALYQRLVDNGFPKTNILLSKERLVTT